MNDLTTAKDLFLKYARDQELSADVCSAVEAILHQVQTQSASFSGTIMDGSWDSISGVHLPEEVVTPPQPAHKPPDFGDIQLPNRYSRLGILGYGGMGVVLRVFDATLGRPVALKLIRRDILDGRREAVLTRFLKEAKLTAQLQHPGVAPVHDLGVLDDGRFFFTLREVTGHTLRQVIGEVHQASPLNGWGQSESGWTFHRLLEVFLRVCETVSYAHDRGVFHRDLKPANIMVGAFGEVVVMDWGIAKIVGAAQEPDEDSVVLDGALSQHTTRTGAVSGTPAYMAPEQAKGLTDQVGPLTDVYALGAILYRILCNRAPYEGSSPTDILRKVIHQHPRVLSRELPSEGEDETLTESLVEEAPLSAPMGPTYAESGSQEGELLPPDMVALCLQAMAREPAERIQSVQILAERVRDYLAGAVRRDAALKVVAQAQERHKTCQALVLESELLISKVRDAANDVKPWDDLERKYPIWSLQERQAQLARQARVEEIRYLQELRSALNHEPGLIEAHTLLADYYYDRLKKAERSRDPDSAACFEVLLRQHDRGKYRRWLEGTGALSLRTKPRGALVKAARYELVKNRLVLGDYQFLGYTPLEAVPVEPGSYILGIESRGCDVVRYPVNIGRGEHWQGVCPEEHEPRSLWLPPAGHLGEGDCYVPAGLFQCGGDPSATDSLPSTDQWCEGFVIQKYPVTVGQYVKFLNSLNPELKKRHAPKLVDREGLTLLEGSDGQFTIAPPSQGGVWTQDMPITLIDWNSAWAYAAWLCKKTGKAWRLPHDFEWEKAARGVDGRFYPWGDHFDARWARMNVSENTKPSPVAVSRYADDCSPYGVIGMAGNVRDWCSSNYQKAVDSSVVAAAENIGEIGEGLRMIRGGCWPDSPQYCRVSGRYANSAESVFSTLGFRLAYSVPREG